MRAAVCTEFGKPFEMQELDLAPPGEGMVHVRIMACAICHSDIIYADGGWGGELPMVFGHEAAGEVIAAGPGVQGFRPGDRCVVTLIRHCRACPCCERGLYGSCETYSGTDWTPLSRDGARVTQGLRTAAFAEQAVVHHSQLVRIDDALSWEAAALLACGVITGYGAVAHTAAMPSGTDVAVIGTGGVGLNCVQGARIGGARRIVAVDLAEDRLASARAFGATETVNGRETDPIEGVRAATGGRGADYVFVAVGSEAAINQSFRMAAPGGAIVLVGMPDYQARARFSPVALSSASQRILGSVMGHLDIKREIPELIRLYRQGELKLDELVTARFPFERINDAMDSTRRGEGLRNVVMIGAAA
jgi:Zn-dependent alcohol dehydrogenase